MNKVIGLTAAVIGGLLLAAGLIWGWAFLVLWTFGRGWYPLTLILVAVVFLLVAVICAAIDDGAFS